MSCSCNDVIYYKKGYKYQLIETYEVFVGIFNCEIATFFINLDVNGMLTIKQGYAWDGASGGIDTDSFMRGSLVHDALCQLIACGLLDLEHRKHSDDVLKQIVKEDNMNAVRAWWVHTAVRRYAERTKHCDKQKPIYFSPIRK